MSDPIIAAFLAVGGYATIEEWAADSDYHYDAHADVWRTDEGYAVDLVGCIEGAIEASGFTV